MDHEMTIDDAANVVRVISDERADDSDRDVSALARAARRLLHQIDELAFSERPHFDRQGSLAMGARR